MVDQPPDRLYGTIDAEQLYRAAAEAYEHQIEPNLERWQPLVDPEAQAIIEEHTVTRSRNHLPSADRVLDDVVEWVADAGEVDEYGAEAFGVAAGSEDVIAAVEAALELLASKVNYFMADKVVATHTITWDETGPLINGEPMYRKVST